MNGHLNDCTSVGQERTISVKMRELHDSLDTLGATTVDLNGALGYFMDPTACQPNEKQPESPAPVQALVLDEIDKALKMVRTIHKAVIDMRRRLV